MVGRYRQPDVVGRGQPAPPAIEHVVSAGFAGAASIIFAANRVNMEPNEPFVDWGRVAFIIMVGAFVAVLAVRAARRRAKRDVLPRKRRLETLLKEFDG
jgi:hypothetical protein